jgi:HSF-type DNA-binding
MSLNGLMVRIGLIYFSNRYICVLLQTAHSRFIVHSCHHRTGRIEVHSPHRLESDVLKKYFRHSKFASFQRQLNYFGFRKLAGKGKMAPCSYVNDSAMNDISSLFHIKVRFHWKFTLNPL